MVSAGASDAPSQLDELRQLALSGDLVLPAEDPEPTSPGSRGLSPTIRSDSDLEDDGGQQDDDLESLANLARGLGSGLGLLDVEGESSLVPVAPLPALPK